MAARILHWKTSLQVWIVTLKFSFKFGGLNKGRHSTTMQIIVLAYQLVHTNWLLNHLEQQRIETLGRVPFCVHVVLSWATDWANCAIHKPPAILKSCSLSMDCKSKVFQMIATQPRLIKISEQVPMVCVNKADHLV